MNDNTTYRVLGIMSGTSLDGIDLAICCFTKNKSWKFKIEKSITLNYSNYWTNILSNLHTKSCEFIEETDKKYGYFIAEISNDFLKGEKVDLIASHGHTIFHQPEKNYTLQIGKGKTIAKHTKITTINNFRNLDVSLNGQGAPLVPVGDQLLFKKYKYCVNLGGFANLTIKNREKIIAYDICAVNILLNQISKKKGQLFDRDGAIARSGKLLPNFLKKLNKLDYFKKAPPKSLSREWVEISIYPLILEQYKTEDILNTLCEHIGMQIGKLLANKEALFTGGGVFNSYLMNRIKYYSKSKIIIPNKTTINFKEALIFAFLGVLRIRNEDNCLKSVTGSIRNSCGGEINKL